MPTPRTSVKAVPLNQGMWLRSVLFTSLTILKVLKGSFYANTTLVEEGLVVQLNHSSRTTCKKPILFPREFTVIHSSGQDVIQIAYCGCKTHIPGNSKVDQLLRTKWMPATWNAPRTAVTFDWLHRFHLLNFQSKCNLYDFYHATLRLQNNADLFHQPVSLAQLSTTAS
jgi:hypothetical protein